MRKTALLSMLFYFATSLISLPVSANEENRFVLYNVDYLHLAYLALQEGNFDRAINLNKRALRTNFLRDRRFIAHVNLCISLRQVEKLDEAETHCTAALRIEPNSWQALNSRANVYYDAGKYAEAEKDYLGALEINPESTIIRENLMVVRQLLTRI